MLGCSAETWTKVRKAEQFCFCTKETDPRLCLLSRSLIERQGGGQGREEGRWHVAEQTPRSDLSSFRSSRHRFLREQVNQYLGNRERKWYVFLRERVRDRHRDWRKDIRRFPFHWNTDNTCQRCVSTVRTKLQTNRYTHTLPVQRFCLFLTLFCSRYC